MDILKLNIATRFAFFYMVVVFIVCFDIFVSYPTPKFGRAGIFITAPWSFIWIYYEHRLVFLIDWFGNGYIYLATLSEALLNAVIIHLFGVVVLGLKKYLLKDVK